MKTCYKKVLMCALLGAFSLQGEASAGAVAAERDGYRAQRSVGQVRKLIAGKTFYWVDSFGYAKDGVDWKNSPGWGTIRCDANASRLTFRVFAPKKRHGSLKIKVVKNGIYGDSEYTLLSVATKKFLQWEDEGYMRWFKTKAAARAYYKKLKRLDRGFPSDLVGKTFYTVFVDNYEHPTLDFGDGKVTISDGADIGTFPYRVEKGVIYVTDGDDTRFHLRRKTPDYIEVAVSWDSGHKKTTARFYTDPDNADAFLRQVRRGDDGIDLGKLIVGKRLYWNAGISEEVKRIEIFSFLKNHRAVVRAFDPKNGQMKILDRFSYRINRLKHLIVTIEGGEKEYHRIIDHGKNWIEIREPEGDVKYLYTNRLSAIDGIVNIDSE